MKDEKKTQREKEFSGFVPYEPYEVCPMCGQQTLYKGAFCTYCGQVQDEELSQIAVWDWVEEQKKEEEGRDD